MRLTTSDKQQIFFDSFDMFKNDWKNNSDTITRAISEVAAFDVEAAIQMWIYILNKNPRRIKTDSGITGRIMRSLPEDAYPVVAKNSVIKNSAFLKSSEPWESINLIIYFLKNSDFYNANELLEIIVQNKNTSEYNYSEYKSSNISTCLYYILDALYNFNDDDIDFLSDWIERIDDKTEKMKLKVLLLSKEKKTDSTFSYNSARTQKKNDYLLDGASLEDLELASSKREEFEIKKIIEFICSNLISTIDFSRLDIFWLNCVFENTKEYSEENFNIIGAYYTIKDMSWDTQRLVKELYKEKVKVESLWKNPYTGDSEFSIKQKLALIQNKIDEEAHRWCFSETINFSTNIIRLFKSYIEHIDTLNAIRNQELLKYQNLSINEIVTTTRVRNILIKNNITDIPGLVRLIDAGTHLEGLGDKSVTDICEKLSQLGICVNVNSVKDDLSFILNYYQIDPSVKYRIEVYDILRLLGIDQRAFSWNFSRSQLIDYLETQKSIAEHYIANYSKNNSLLENMSLLKKDDTSIYLPGKYFFTNISITSFLRNY